MMNSNWLSNETHSASSRLWIGYIRQTATIALVLNSKVRKVMPVNKINRKHLIITVGTQWNAMHKVDLLSFLLHTVLE